MNKAFTLVESLVTIFIILVLSLIILPNYNSAKQQLALQRSAFKLAQDIRVVQEMATSVRECEPPPDSCPVGGGVPDGGYGIYFDQNKPDYYIIYADSGSSPKQYRYTSGEEIETIDLEKEVKIKSVSTPKASINFMPPDPIIGLKDDAGGDHEYVEIIISLKTDSSKTKTIKVNKAGLIYVE